MKKLLCAAVLGMLPGLCFGQIYNPGLPLSGGTMTGDIIGVPGLYSTRSIVDIGTGKLPTNTALYWNGTITGTCTDAANCYNGIYLGLDTSDTSAAANGGYLYLFQDNYGGGSSKGNHGTVYDVMNIFASPTGSGGQYVAHSSLTQISANLGGTGGAYSGIGYAENPFCRLVAGATFIDRLICTEEDMSVATGITYHDFIGHAVVITSGHAQAGDRDNAAYVLSAQANTTPGFDYGLQVGGYNGYSPMATTGTVVGCFPHLGAGSCGTIANGMDLSNFTISGNFLKSAGFTVDGAGKTGVPQLTISGNISAPAWTSAGIGLKVIGATYNDTTSTGTVAIQAVNAFAIPALTSTSAVTYTDAATVYIAGPPTASTNVTIATPRSLWVATGISRFDGLIRGLAGVTISGAASSINSASQTLTTFGGHIQYSGAAAPVLTACGGTPAIDANASDAAGTVTEGSVSTGCTITFNTSYTTVPHCTVTSQAGLVFTYTVSATAIVVTNVGALSSTNLNYMCAK